MKHFLYILLCLLACTRSAYAQQWHFGVEGGYTLNSFHAPTLHTSSRSGFKAGGVVNYTFKSNFLLESGLAFERKGGTLSGSSIAGQRINQVEVNNMDYLHLPFLMGYAFHLGKQFALLPQAGGYLIRASEAVDSVPDMTRTTSPTQTQSKYFLPTTIYITALSAEWMQACFSLPACNTGNIG